MICAALRLTVDYVIVYIADMAAIFGSTGADEFTLQQQNVKTKAATLLYYLLIFLAIRHVMHYIYYVFIPREPFSYSVVWEPFNTYKFNIIDKKLISQV